MRTITILFLIFLSCSGMAREVYNIPLQVIFVDSLLEIPLQEMENGYPRFAGMYKKEGNICKVWLIRPKNWDDAFALHVFGHEAFHCIKGPHTKEYMESHYEQK